MHYLWSGVTILNLLFPISPFLAFGYYRLATLGPRLDLFENNQGGVHSIKSFMPNYSFWKGRRNHSFHWFLKAINPRFPHIYSPSRIGSASDDEPMRKLYLLLAWRPIGRLNDWVESSTVLNSEKDFSKFDQRESHY